MGILQDKKKSAVKTVAKDLGLKKMKKFFFGAKSSMVSKVKGKPEVAVKEKELEDPADKQAEEQVEAAAGMAAEKAFEDPAGKQAGETLEKPLAVGQKVRLTEEDLSFQLRFGEEGVVKECEENQALVMFENAFAAVTVPLSLLTRVPPGGFSNAGRLKGLCRMSQEVKVSLLRRAGVGDPLEDEVTPWGDEMLADQTIDLFAAIVRENLSLLKSPKVRYIPTMLSRYLLEDATGEAAGPDAHDARPEVKERRLKVLKRFYDEGASLMVPIFGGAHWTLLRIWKHEGAETEVEYFDSLSHQHPVCLSKAQAFLRLLGLPDSGLMRKNLARQSGVDCGHWVCFYLEDGLRAVAGQGKATQGWPSAHMSAFKARTKAWHGLLSAAFEKWRAQRVEEHKNEATFRKRQAEAARAYLEKQGLLAKLLEAQAALAKAMSELGAASEGPPLPAGFGEKPKKTSAEAAPALVEAVASGEALAVASPIAEGSVHSAEAPAALVEAFAAGQAPPEAGEAAETVDAKSADAPAPEEAKAAPAAGEAIVAEATGKLKAVSVKAKPVLVLTEDQLLEVELCKDDWTVENLQPQFRAAYEKVKDRGVGICASCRWTNGCLRCMPSKAWDYYVRQSLGYGGSKAKPKKKGK